MFLYLVEKTKLFHKFYLWINLLTLKSHGLGDYENEEKKFKDYKTRLSVSNKTIKLEKYFPLYF